MSEVFQVFLCFCLLYQEYYLLDLSFCCFFNFSIKIYFCLSIKFRSSKARLFAASFILASKLLFVHLLNSGVVIKLVASSISFSIWGFCIQSSFGSQIRNVRYFNYNLCGFCIQSTFVTRLVISGILFSDSVVFVFSMKVVTDKLALGNLFSIPVIFMF